MMIEEEFVTIDLAEPCDICHQATGVPLQSCDHCKQPLSGFRTLPFRKVSTPMHLGLMGHKACFQRAHDDTRSIPKGSRTEAAVGSSSSPDITVVCDTTTPTTTTPMLQAFTDIMTRSVNSLFSKTSTNDLMSTSFHEEGTSEVSRRHSETTKNNKSKRVSRDYSDSTMKGHNVITKRRGNVRRAHDQEMSAKRTAKKRPDETSSSNESEDNYRVPVYSGASLSKIPLLAKPHDRPKHRRHQSYSMMSTRTTPQPVSPDGTSTSESDSIELCVGKMKTFQSHKRSKSSPVVHLTKENLAVMQQQVANNTKYPNIKTNRCLVSGMPDIVRCSNITSESSSSPDSSRMSSDEVGKPKSARSIAEETFRSDSDMSPDFIIEQNMIFVEDITPESESDLTALLSTCRNRRNSTRSGSGKDTNSDKSKSSPPHGHNQFGSDINGQVEPRMLTNNHCSNRTAQPAKASIGKTCGLPPSATLPGSLPRPPAPTVTQVSPLVHSTSAISCLFPICGDTDTLSQAFLRESPVTSPKTRPYSNIYEQSSGACQEDEEDMGIFSYNSRSRKKWLRSQPRCKSESYLHCPLIDNLNNQHDIYQFCSQAGYNTIMEKSIGYSSPNKDVNGLNPASTKPQHSISNPVSQDKSGQDLCQSNGNANSGHVSFSGGSLENENGCGQSMEDCSLVSGSLDNPIRGGGVREGRDSICGEAASDCSHLHLADLTAAGCGTAQADTESNTIVKCKSCLGDNLAAGLVGVLPPAGPLTACCHRRVPCAGRSVGASQSGPAAGGEEFRSQPAVSWDVPTVVATPDDQHCLDTEPHIIMDLPNKASHGGGKISPDRIRPHVARRRPISMYASRHVAYPHWDSLADQYARSKVMLLSRTWYECSQDFLMSRKACRTGYETTGINCRDDGVITRCKVPLKELNFSGINSEVTPRAKTLMEMSDEYQPGSCNFEAADGLNKEWQQAHCGSHPNANNSPDYNCNKTSNCSKYVASTRIKLRKSSRPKSIGDFSLLRTNWDYSSNCQDVEPVACSEPVSNTSSMSGSISYHNHSSDSLPSNADTNHEKATTINCVVQNCQIVPQLPPDHSLGLSQSCSLQTMDTDQSQTTQGNHSVTPTQSQNLWDEFSLRQTSSSADGLCSQRVEVDGDILDGPLPPVESQNGCLKAEDGVAAVAIETTANGLVLTEALKYTRDKRE